MVEQNIFGEEYVDTSTFFDEAEEKANMIMDSEDNEFNSALEVVSTAYDDLADIILEQQAKTHVSNYDIENLRLIAEWFMAYYLVAHNVEQGRR